MKKTESIILGFIIGDCYGAPYEFLDKDRAVSQFEPRFIGGGVHDQKLGIWSDGTAFSLALMRTLSQYEELMARSVEKFEQLLRVNLLNNTQFTPSGEDLFDVGAQTQKAIDSNFAIGHSFNENGSGGLMRVWPLAIYFFQKGISGIWDQVNMIKMALKPTHSHELSLAISFLYVRLLYSGLEGLSTVSAYTEALEHAKFCFGGEFFDDFPILLSGFESMEVFGDFDSGFVKNTFVNVMGSLNFSQKYEANIFNMIQNGGDADTNAALLGAMHQAFRSEDLSTYKREIVNFSRVERIVQRFVN